MAYASLCPARSIYSLEPPSQGMVLPTVGGSFHLSEHNLDNHHRTVQRLSSEGILDSVTLAVSTNHNCLSQKWFFVFFYVSTC